MSHQHTFERRRGHVQRNCSACFPSDRVWILIVCSIATLAASAVAELPPSEVPISRSDIRQISRVIRKVTDKPILVIMGMGVDHYVPGAVLDHTYQENIDTGERIPCPVCPRYTRTDYVAAYMQYSDRSRVDIYIVRKVHGRWKIESKKEGFL
jgi:hypothetical protein